MAQYNLLKRYYEFRGLDLRAPDVERQQVYSPDNKNTDYISTGGIKKREGIKISGKNYGIYGAHRFQSVTYFGEEKDELILFGSVDDFGVESGLMYRMQRQKITISNFLLSNNDATVTFKYNDATSLFEFSIIESNGNVLLTKPNISPTINSYTVSDLKTDIDAISGIFTNILILGSNTTYAYMIDIIDANIPYGLTRDLYYYTMEEITGTTYGPAAFNIDVLNNYIGKNRQVSATLLNGILYVAGLGSYPPMKYDGFSSYGVGCRVGPMDGYGNIARFGQIVDNSPALVSPRKTSRGLETFSNTNLTSNTTASYWAVLQQIDATGNVTTSKLIELDTTTLVAGQNARYTNGGSTNYYNTFQKKNNAIINGTQTNTNYILVNTGHNLLVGDMACLWCTNQNMLLYREITAVSVDRITISTKATVFGVAKNDRAGNLADFDSGGNVSVLDDGFITAGTSAAIYRSKAAGFTPFFCLEFPMNNFGTAIDFGFIDDLSDAQLGAAYLTPSTPENHPPNCEYVSSYNNSLMLGALETQKESIAYSNALQVESFSSINQFILEKTVTGMGQSGEIFMAATDQSIYAVSGDLNSFAFRVDKIASNIGCVAHATIQQVDEGTLFFLSEKGPYMFSSGRGLVPVGQSDREVTPRIEPIFTDFYNNDKFIPIFSKATSGVWKTEKKYYLYIPYTLNDGNNNVDPREDYGQIGLLFVYDYARDSWLQWSGIRATMGIYEFKDNPYFIGVYKNASDELESKIQKQQRAKTIYAYCDHNNPIDFNYDFQWEALGESSVFKKFLRLNLFGTNNRVNPNQLIGIRTYKDYDNSNLRTDSQIQWAGEANRKIKLKNDKMKAMKIRIYDDSVLAGYNNPIEINGYELEVATSFKGRIKQ